MPTQTPLHDACVLALVTLAEFWGLGVLTPLTALDDSDLEDDFILGIDGPSAVELLEQVLEECQTLDEKLAQWPFARAVVGDPALTRAFDLLCSTVELAQECRDIGSECVSMELSDLHCEEFCKDAWKQMGGRYQWWGHDLARDLPGSDFAVVQNRVRELRAIRNLYDTESVRYGLVELQAEKAIWRMQQLLDGVHDLAKEAWKQILDIADSVRQSRFREADRLFDPQDHVAFELQCMAHLFARREDPVIEDEEEIAVRTPETPDMQTKVLALRKHLIAMNMKRRNRFLHFQKQAEHVVYSLEHLSAFKEDGVELPAPPGAEYFYGGFKDTPIGLVTKQTSTYGFTCPACLDCQPPRLAGLFETWNYHIEDDLRPYICLEPDCHDSIFSDLAEDGSAWQEHMLDEHYWTLPACPFCCWPSQVNAVIPEHLLAHIAIELQYFALLALPWATSPLTQPDAFKQWYERRYPREAVLWYDLERPQLEQFYDCFLDDSSTLSSTL
ncbi:uncharacterized protein BP01DRAFT_380027 [Aspergillus saccharolyticus JOP 1030-1]|uniref:C2H2-type domain-containing protein n=1 Tax=Aspergillus saccharolyticus JOP 1030-1 TaxID=1450539 RepID=A0A318ZKJ2_9EURO|nr:hypothetical protein BP01DRAFT_380027 [Aspergillus saccharolyticus JOP 1030-1]PYH48111.1 hypothetical protein BP01DRAFT_380027 [Aspergillus saccharolyticus JOP 1030-1]